LTGSKSTVLQPYGSPPSFADEPVQLKDGFAPMAVIQASTLYATEADMLA
jgi:hypothetical protein